MNFTNPGQEKELISSNVHLLMLQHLHQLQVSNKICIHYNMKVLNFHIITNKNLI